MFVRAFFVGLAALEMFIIITATVIIIIIILTKLTNYLYSSIYGYL